MPDELFTGNTIGKEKARSSPKGQQQPSTQIPAIPPCTSTGIARVSPSLTGVQGQKALRLESLERPNAPDLREGCSFGQDKQARSSSRQRGVRESCLGSERPIEAHKAHLPNEGLFHPLSSEAEEPEDVPKLSLPARSPYLSPINRQVASKHAGTSFFKEQGADLPLEKPQPGMSLVNLFIVIDCDDSKEDRSGWHPLGLIKESSSKSKPSEETDGQSSKDQAALPSISLRSDRLSCKRRLFPSSDDFPKSPQFLPISRPCSSSESSDSSRTANAAQRLGFKAAFPVEATGGPRRDSTWWMETSDDVFRSGKEETASPYEGDCNSPFLRLSENPLQKEKSCSHIRKSRSIEASMPCTPSTLASSSSSTYPGLFAFNAASKEARVERLQHASTPLNSPVQASSSQSSPSFPSPSSSTATLPNFNPRLSAEKIKKLKSRHKMALRLLRRLHQHNSPAPTNECVLISWISIKNVPAASQDDPDAPFLFRPQRNCSQSTDPSYLIHRSWDTQRFRVDPCEEFYGKTTEEALSIHTQRIKRREKLKRLNSTHSGLVATKSPTLTSSQLPQPRPLLQPKTSGALAKRILHSLRDWMESFSSIVDGTEHFFVQNFFAKQHVALSLRILADEDGHSVKACSPLSRFTIVDEVFYVRQRDRASAHFPYPCMLLPSETDRDSLVYMYVSENFNDGNPYTA